MRSLFAKIAKMPLRAAVILLLAFAAGFACVSQAAPLYRKTRIHVLRKHLRILGDKGRRDIPRLINTMMASKTEEERERSAADLNEYILENARDRKMILDELAALESASE